MLPEREAMVECWLIPLGLCGYSANESNIPDVRAAIAGWIQHGGGKMRSRIALEYDAETNSYAAYCPELPGYCSAGDTEEEALANAKEAVALYLEPSSLELKADQDLH